MTARDVICFVLGFGACILVTVVGSIFSKRIKHYLEGR